MVHWLLIGSVPLRLMQDVNSQIPKISHVKTESNMSSVYTVLAFLRLIRRQLLTVIVPDGGSPPSRTVSSLIFNPLAGW